jgi:hypothetical protein
MTLRTDIELEQALTELAELEGTSKQEVVRRAVLEKRERLNRGAKLESIVGDLLVEYKDALDRLGTV